MVFFILDTFSNITHSGRNFLIISTVGIISLLRGSSGFLFPSRISRNIFPAPLDDIPWQGGVA